MSPKPLISLCLPTNGVAEWVFPVLNSIYAQGVDKSLYEVVITDNGKNDHFKRQMREYLNTHSNIVYAETEALPFINEIESYKRASGELLKFVNHRTLLVEGTLEKLIRIATDYSETRPIIYFANGVLQLERTVHKYDTFDQFVRNLSYWSSWSTGMAIWKDDFRKLPEDVSSFNELFPHTDILFAEKDRGLYLIDNTVIFDEMPQGNKPKGDYDLFYAFGVEYPWIICNLVRNGSISSDTFRYVVDKNLDFVAGLYVNYCIRKQYCSYDLSGEKNMYGIFYTKSRLMKKAALFIAKKLAKTVLKR